MARAGSSRQLPSPDGGGTLRPMADLDRVLADSLAHGEAVARATVVSGVNTGRRLLVWSAGQVFGDLGWPRLNQRVALFAEQLLASSHREAVKPFDLPDGEVTVRVELLRPPGRQG